MLKKQDFRPGFAGKSRSAGLATGFEQVAHPVADLGRVSPLFSCENLGSSRESVRR